MEVSGVTDHVEAVALAYCTDHPLRLTDVLPALKISMKSLRNGAPEFPPPPKTWLITTCGDALGVGDGLGVGETLGVGEGLGDGDGDGDGVGVGVGVEVGVGVGVGVAPASTSDTGLLCMPSADATSVAVPAPRNSAGTST